MNRLEALIQIRQLLAEICFIPTKQELIHIAIRVIALIQEIGEDETLTYTQKRTTKDIARDLKKIADGLVVKEEK